MMGLKDVKEWLHYCGRCNSCKYIYRVYEPSCPAFEKFKWEPYTSSGKVWIARDLFEGKYELSQSICDKVFACTLCGNCTIQCQQEIGDHALDIFEALREECIEAGYTIPAHLKFRENVEELQNPYGEKHDKRWEGIDDKYFKDSAEVYFFVGCTTSLRNKTLFSNILKLLDYLGVDFTLARDEWCCGSPLLTTGQKKSAKFLAEHNTDLIAKLGAKTVITACAGCFRTLHSQYPSKYGLLTNQNHFNANKEIVEKTKDTENEKDTKNIRVLHISQYLNEIIDKKNIKIKHPKEINVTYHDPCHLGRHVGVFEEPREVLKKLKGVHLIEMPRNRDNAWCCGAGAGVKSGFKDWALEISEDRLREAMQLQKTQDINIDYMISTCPFCERNLSDARKSLIDKGELSDSSLKVIDLVELINLVLKQK
ncbi:MAG: hypothetical protein GF364_06315 [Candidatus Lokiarchaeota archaeon]|nr:hypothetical protein [Candidatus Lokiarchaeota archaeon]